MEVDKFCVANNGLSIYLLGMGATGRAKRIDSYLMSERKKDDNEREQCPKRNRNNIVSYRGRVGESERERKGKVERKCRKSSTASHLKPS